MDETKEKTNPILAILRSPWALIAAIVLGILISQYAKPLVPAMNFFSDVYLNLLQMCVIPIVICAVTVNIGSLIKTGSRSTLVKWLLLFASTLILFTALSVGISALFSDAIRPDEDTSRTLASLSGDSDSSIDNYVTRIEYGGDHVNAEKQTYSLSDFIFNLFPKNIFASLANGDMLSILLFFILLGVVLALIDKEHSSPVYKAFDGIYAAMNQLIGFILIPFPIAMMAMLAQQFSADGVFELIGSLIPLVLIILGSVLLTCVITFICIQISTGCSLKEHWLAIKRSFFIAIGTSSCLATVGVALEDSCKHLKIKPQLAKSILPISISMCQPGVAVSVAVAAVYGMLIYGIPFSANTLVMVIVCPIIFSLAVIGVPGLVAVSMLTIVLDPLFIPSALIITIYLTIIPVINPAVVFAGVYSNFGIVSLLNREEKRHDHKY